MDPRLSVWAPSIPATPLPSAASIGSPLVPDSVGGSPDSARLGPRRLTRRSVLGLLGAAGATGLLAACGGGGGGATQKIETKPAEATKPAAASPATGAAASPVASPAAASASPAASPSPVAKPAGSPSPAASPAASPSPAAGASAAGAAAASGPVTVGGFPSRSLRLMAPAAPGGGWDSTSRAVQQVLQDEKIAAQSVEVFNRPGAGGTIGLAELINQTRGDGHTVMTMGLVMTGAILTNKSPVSLDTVTPLARLTTEYEAIAVGTSSPYQTFQDLISAFKADARSIKWGGGSAGGTDHIAGCLRLDPFVKLGG